MTSRNNAGEQGSRAFPKANRILKTREFSRIQKNSRRVYSKNFTVLLAEQKASGKAEPNDRLTVKLGITVSRKTEASAVRRNRIKRIVREAFRAIKEFCVPGLAIILIAKNSCYDSSTQQIRQEMLGLLRMNKCLIEK